MPDLVREFVRSDSSYFEFSPSRHFLFVSRIYEYLIPTYVFQPAVPNTPRVTEPTLVHEQSQDNSFRKPWVNIPVATPEEMVEKRKYRIPADTLHVVRQGFKEYEGTHNFHNYTSGRTYHDRSCDRYIVKFEVSML